jgi:hypothetical protein
MTSRRDYGCEIMGLIVLTVLSALSHFWYILIAVCVISALVAAGFLISSIFLRIRRELLARLLAPRRSTETETGMSVDIARSSRPSLPVA